MNINQLNIISAIKEYLNYRREKKAAAQKLKDDDAVKSVLEISDEVNNFERDIERFGKSELDEPKWDRK